MTRKRHYKLTPELIEYIHHYLPPDAHPALIHEMAAATALSYSTVWHVVRGYCRHPDAPWRTHGTHGGYAEHLNTEETDD